MAFRTPHRRIPRHRSCRFEVLEQRMLMSGADVHVVRWTGNVSKDWFAPKNWLDENVTDDPKTNWNEQWRVPDKNDTALFNRAGNYIVKSGVGPTVGTISVKAGNVTFTGEGPIRADSLKLSPDVRASFPSLVVVGLGKVRVGAGASLTVSQRLSVSTALFADGSKFSGESATVEMTSQTGAVRTSLTLRGSASFSAGALNAGDTLVDVASGTLVVRDLALLGNGSLSITTGAVRVGELWISGDATISCGKGSIDANSVDISAGSVTFTSTDPQSANRASWTMNTLEIGPTGALLIEQNAFALVRKQATLWGRNYALGLAPGKPGTIYSSTDTIWVKGRLVVGTVASGSPLDAGAVRIAAGGVITMRSATLRASRVEVTRTDSTHAGCLYLPENYRHNLVRANVVNAGLVSVGDHYNRIEGTYQQQQTGVMEVDYLRVASRESTWDVAWPRSYLIPVYWLNISSQAILGGTLRFTAGNVFGAAANDSRKARLLPMQSGMDILLYGSLGTLARFGNFENAAIVYRDAAGKLCTSTKLFLGLDYQRNYLRLMTLETPRLFVPVSGGWSDQNANGEKVRLTDPGRKRAQNLILIAPGSKATADGWVREMAIAMAMQAKVGGTWDVATLDWTQYNTGTAADPVNGDWKPWTAGTYGINIGESLGRWLRQVGRGDYQHVHILSHSAGVWLADALADELKRQGVGTTALRPSIHLTLFDAFTPQGTSALQQEAGRFAFTDTDIYRWGGARQDGTLTSREVGDTADYAEHFLDKRDTVGMINALPFTNETLPQCFNVDLTSLAVDYSNNPFKNADASHAWPHRYYLRTVRRPNDPVECPMGMGFFYSKERTGTVPSHTAQRARGTLWAPTARSGKALAAISQPDRTGQVASLSAAPFTRLGNRENVPVVAVKPSLMELIDTLEVDRDRSTTYQDAVDDVLANTADFWFLEPLG